MLNNVLFETTYIQQMYAEYLSIVNRYENVDRKSIFCRYLNINPNYSRMNTPTDATFDHYSSGVVYDIYDLTPIFNINPIINNHENKQELKGQMYTGNTSITLYTIKQPHVHDLIMYQSVNSLEIWKVVNVSSAINAKQSDSNFKWSELSLEYAPIININKLNFIDHYVYSLPLQEYLFKKDFDIMLKETEKMEELFNTLQDTSFNPYYELFYINDNNTGLKLAPLYENNFIYLFLTSIASYLNHFESVKRPFGVKQYSDLSLGVCVVLNDDVENYSRGDLVNFNRPAMYDLPINSTILSYNRNINIYNMCVLIDTWKWVKEQEDKGLPRTREKISYYNSPIDIPLDVLPPKLDGIFDKSSRTNDFKL